MGIKGEEIRKRETPAGNNDTSKNVLVHDWPPVSDATGRSRRIKIRNMSLGLEYKRPPDEVVAVGRKEKIQTTEELISKWKLTRWQQ